MGLRRGLATGRFEPSKVVFITLIGASLLGAAFYLGLRAGVERNAAFRFTTAVTANIERSVSVTAGEFVSTLRARPTHFLQLSRYWGEGVTVNDPANNQDDLILISGFFKDSNELRLIRRNGAIVARWPVRFFNLFPDPDYFPPGLEPASEWNIDLHGAVALPDGSVVFNFEFGGLAKLDRCGNAVWTLRRQTHHSVERAEGGGFWVPGRRLVLGQTSPYPPFETPIREDTILKVSDEGQVLDERPVAKVFYDNELEALLTAFGSVYRQQTEWGQEIVHLNKIEELTADIAGDFPMFEAGDLSLIHI